MRKAWRAVRERRCVKEQGAAWLSHAGVGSSPNREGCVIDFRHPSRAALNKIIWRAVCSVAAAAAAAAATAATAAASAAVA